MNEFEYIKEKVMLKATKTLVKEVLNFPYITSSDNSNVYISKFLIGNSVADIEFNRSEPKIRIFKKDFSKKAYEISKLYTKIFNQNIDVNHLY